MEKIADELRELKKLQEEGILSEEEFNAKKRELLEIKTKPAEPKDLSMFGWYGKVWNSYGTFMGRARRKEYWYFVLVNFFAQVVLYAMDCALFDAYYTDNTYFSGLYALLIFVPSLAVTIRRLHDTNRSGWWLLLACIPIIGSVILLVILAEDSDYDTNQYGDNPKA